MFFVLSAKVWLGYFSHCNLSYLILLENLDILNEAILFFSFCSYWPRFCSATQTFLISSSKSHFHFPVAYIFASDLYKSENFQYISLRVKYFKMTLS
jgi:hypothetical protein